jgi:hypothetical protein
MTDRDIEVVGKDDVVTVILRDEVQTAKSVAVSLSWAEARELRDLLIEECC